MRSGLNKIKADSRDYSLLHTFGALQADAAGLPAEFSVYDGRTIPNQDDFDDRFVPALTPLPEGCTAETGTFDAAIQDAIDLYNPKDMYDNTPPGTPSGGRDMRKALTTLIKRGPRQKNGAFGPLRKAYFNVYGAGKIDDFDAARIAVWINQAEKRGVWTGTYWYPEFAVPNPNGTLRMPSFNTSFATLHCHLITGWKTIDGAVYLEDISWQGGTYGNKGIVYFSREQYNALMAQPYTGAFTITKYGSDSPVPIGITAIIDQLVYFIRDLFSIKPNISPAPVPQPDVPPKNNIATWALAIQHEEGGNPTDRNMRNCNPGNLRLSPYTKSLGAVDADSGNFCVFPDYQTGFKALCSFLTAACSDELQSYKGIMTLDAFTNTYAQPPSKNYVNAVAKALGITPSTSIKELL